MNKIKICFQLVLLKILKNLGLLNFVGFFMLFHATTHLAGLL